MIHNNSIIVFWILLLTLNCSVSHATLMTTPEPAMDPLAASQLVVSSAGRPWMRRRIREKRLTNGSRICPRDYPKGFTIRCDSAQQVRKARFYINGVLFRTEHQEPYYISGNKKSLVKRWKRKMGTVKVSCKLGRKETVSARITIGC